MNVFEQISKPTLLLNEETARRNIRQMAQKAHAQNICFRPHFKTHQSAVIGEWFREEGVTAITTSSLDMATYFAKNGWDQITIAFPVNWREIKGINQLAHQVHLGLLVESVETVNQLTQHLSTPVDVWIKIDVGYHRTGLLWDQPKAVQQVLDAVQHSPMLRRRGLLTHGGHTYHPERPEDICRMYRESVARINAVRRQVDTGEVRLDVSVGDTPGCVKCSNLGEVDEIRPGNFVFFDAQQLQIESCRPEDIAVALACPVVAKHPERQEVVIFGGAIHLSKDLVEEKDHTAYGYVALSNEKGWGNPLPGAYVSRLSQEHGVVHMEKPEFDQINLGDLLCILPAHSCLTVQAMQEYLTLDGKIIPTMLSEK